MTDRYTNVPTRNAGALTTHDPTATQGGGVPPASTEEIIAAHDVVFSDYASQFPERTDYTEESQATDLTNNAMPWIQMVSLVQTDVATITGRNQAHGILWLDGKLFVITVQNPSYIIRFNDPLNNLADYTEQAFPSDGNHLAGADLVYVPSKGKIYVVNRTSDAHVLIDEVDPTTLAITNRVNDTAHEGDTVQFPAIASDGTYLYGGYNISVSSRIIRYNLSDWAFDAEVVLPGRFDVHTMEYDQATGFIFATGAEIPAWIARINPDNFSSPVSQTFAANHNVVTDDLAFYGDYVYVGLESLSGLVMRIKKTDLADQTDYATNDNEADGVYEHGGRIWSIHRSTPGVITIRGPDGSGLQKFVQEAGSSRPDEMAFDEAGHAFTAQFTSPIVVRRYDVSFLLTTPDATIEEVNAAHLIKSDWEVHEPQYDPFAENSGVDVSTDVAAIVSAITTEQIGVSDTINVAVSDSSAIEVQEGGEAPAAELDLWILDIERHFPPEFWPWEHSQETIIAEAAEIAIGASDTLNIVIDDTSQVDKFESIEGLVAANYTTFQGTVEAQSPQGLTVEDFSTSAVLDTSFIFATREVSVSDTLNVVLDDQVALDTGEIEAIFAANYSTPARSPEDTLAPLGLTIENNSTPTVIDTTFIFATRNVDVSDAINVVLDDQAALQVLGGVEDLIASNYTTFQGSVEPLDDPALTIEDYSTATVLDVTFLTAAVSKNVIDTLNITVDDQAVVEAFEGIVGLVVANYSTFYGTVEAFQLPVLTIENYSVASVQDVAYIFATINVAVTESINVVLDDTSTLTQLEGIAGLVAAGYSTFFGTVEALFPPQTTIENDSSNSLDVSAFIVLSGPPPPPMPWGPFEAVVDDYTYTTVVDIFETTSSDEVYQPIEPEEGG